MSDAPVCIICGIQPTTAFPSKNIFHPKNGCILSTTQRLFTFEQWQKLMARPEPDNFWEINDPEHHYRDPDEFANECFDWQDRGTTVEYTLMGAITVPNRKMRVTLPPCGDTYDIVPDAEWEWIE